MPARSKDFGVAGVLAGALALAFYSTPSFAQSAYKYRDANGEWVYTDRAAPSAARESSINLGHKTDTVRITIERTDHDKSTQLTAINGCLCVVAYQAKIIASDDPAIAPGTEYRAVLAPGTQRTLIQIAHTVAGRSEFRYAWRAILGSPQATHQPPGPYRAPFALGSTFVISQAYPDQFTHTEPESAYAVDIALPDETPVYAAREGIVIDMRHDAYRDALAPVMLDQANYIEILHDDGTIAMYAHLHWDSIRVHVGQHVDRGAYIANSGNTGFTSGPHLHFAVLRNGDFMPVSVPIQFAGRRDTAVTPLSRMRLTAY